MSEFAKWVIDNILKCIVSYSEPIVQQSPFEWIHYDTEIYIIYLHNKTSNNTLRFIYILECLSQSTANYEHFKKCMSICCRVKVMDSYNH